MQEDATKHETELWHHNLKRKHTGASARRGIGKGLGGIWLSKWHRLLPADHTNLGGQVLGGVPPSHPSLQEGHALTEELSAVELQWEEQRVELEMTDRKGYGLSWVFFPRENKAGDG